MEKCAENEQNSEFMTVSQVKEILPLGRDKVYKIMRSPSFPAIKFGRQYVVRRKDFCKWWDDYRGKEFIL